MLDDPGVAVIHLENSGWAILDQLERVPLAVWQNYISHGPLHLPTNTCIWDIVDVAVPQLREGKEIDVEYRVDDGLMSIWT